MDCALLATGLPPDAQPPRTGSSGCDAAQRFKDAVQIADAGNDLYVNGPAASQASGALSGLMTQLQSIDFKLPGARAADGAASPSEARGPGRGGTHSDTRHDTLHDVRPDTRHDADDARRDSAPDDDFAAAPDPSFGEQIVAIQAEIFRSTLMMETINSAKQGVTTLFQQQG